MRGLILSLLLIVTLFGYGQVSDVGELRERLGKTKEDTALVLLFRDLSFAYKYYKPDSALYFANRGLKLAQEINFKYGEAANWNNLGLAFWKIGNYPRALSSFLKALKINEEIDDKKKIAVNLGNIANMYAEQNDQQHALDFTLKALHMHRRINDTVGITLQLLNAGDSYEKLNRLDSARRFTQDGYEMALKRNDVENLGLALNNLGNIYAKMGQPEIALGYYRVGIPYMRETNFDEAICETTLGMARILQSQNQTDSALFYARISLETALRNNFPKRVLNASSFISAHYKNLGLLDSAFTYQEMMLAAKDTLFSQEKVKEVQNMFFNEKIRQQEIEEARAKAAEERKHNLQMVGIAVFIITFMLFLLLISKRKLKPRTIELLGILALLMVFEFISLLIHPFIADITHHQPVFLLFFLVCIAGVLVPMHHKLEHWFIQKLSHKPAEPVPVHSSPEQEEEPSADILI